MASEADQGYMPSILDRLIDPESAGVGGRRGYRFEDMRDTIKRDLENLLNTRPVATGLPDASEINQSIIAYGLPDLTSFTAVTKAQWEEIGRLIEKTIRRFEPRLRDVHVTLQVAPDGTQGRVQFRISGRLGVDEAPEVAFDTRLELTTGRYSLQAT